jgi:hypothetical protein
MTRQGYIYVAGPDERKWCKVDISSNIAQRMQGLWVSKSVGRRGVYWGPFDWSVVRGLEQAVLHALADSRQEGEWVLITQEGLIDAVERVARETGIVLGEPTKHRNPRGQCDDILDEGAEFAGWISRFLEGHTDSAPDTHPEWARYLPELRADRDGR